MATTTANFEAFLRAYYEWLEQTNQPHEVISNLRDYRNIDTTIDDFVEYFRREYMVAIPANTLADKHLLVDHIKKFYHNKGNKNSFQFLFRILYGEDIEVYLPKVDILRASDGKWSQVISIKIIDEGWTDISFFFSQRIIGQTSFASANVETIMRYSEGNTDILELTFYDLSGEFIQGENILVNDIDDIEITLTVLEVASRINIIEGGSRYGVGEKINLKLNGELVGTGFIKAVGRGPVTAINVINGGTGYRGNLREITDFAYLPIGYSWGGTEPPYLPDAPIQAQDSNDFDFASSPISFPVLEFLEDIGDIVDIDDTPDPIGRNATAVVSLVSQTGEILEVEVLSEGQDYNLPVAEVISETGTGAILEVEGGGGSITRTQLNEFPINPDDSNGIIVEVVTTQGIGADLELLYNSGMIKYKGTWINTDGFLSSDKKLQDNFFYQDFSYVILSGILHSRWKDVVKKIAHPAGFQEFGRIKLKGAINNNVEIDETGYVTLGNVLTAETGVFTEEGGSLNTLIAEGGIFTVTGLEKTDHVNMPADSGTFNVSGQNVNFLITYIGLTDTGNFILTGTDITTLIAEGGTFTLTGGSVNLFVPVLIADVGTFTIAVDGVPLGSGIGAGIGSSIGGGETIGPGETVLSYSG